MITNDNLLLERPHLNGTQRLYQFGQGYSLSLVNAPMLHGFPFKWEGAVIKDGTLDYSTPLTSDVRVFESDEEANAWIGEALTLWGSA